MVCCRANCWHTEWLLFLWDSARGICHLIYNCFMWAPGVGSCCAASTCQGGEYNAVWCSKGGEDITQRTPALQGVGIVRDIMTAFNAPIWHIQILDCTWRVTVVSWRSQPGEKSNLLWHTNDLWKPSSTPASSGVSNTSGLKSAAGTMHCACFSEGKWLHSS